MIVCETRTFTLGKFTVRQSPRFDNPAWAVYTVYLGDKVIGKSFSIPDLGCCEYLERWDGYYVHEEDHYQRAPLKLRGAIKSRAKRKEDSALFLDEALAST